MGAISSKGRTAFRRYVTDNVPGSGNNEPDKAEIIDFVDEIDAEVGALQDDINSLVVAATSGVIGFETLAIMNADLDHPAGTIGRVMNDPTPSNNGDYRKTGDSGSGSWVKQYDNSKTIHVAPAVSGGDGSIATPYNIAEATAAVAADTSRDRIEVILKGGQYRITTPLRFDVPQWREVVVRSVLGMTATILCSEAILSGSAAFTQPDAGGNPNVWMTSHKWGTTNNSTTNSGGLVDIDHSSACGRSGTYRSPVTVYTDIGANQSLATMNSTSYRGCTSIQTTGTYAGKILVHALSSANPNTINFERMLSEFGIWATTSLGTDFNAAKISVEGVTVQYGVTAGIWIDRCQVDFHNVSSQYSRNYGFQFNQSDGIVSKCVSIGSQADGFNANGVLLDASVGDKESKLVLIGCRTEGVQQSVAPPVLAQVVGDGFSNHNTQQWHLIDCVALGATKDGYSMTDTCKLSNCDADDCSVGGLTVASQSSKAITADVFGGKFSNCTYGVQANANDTNSPPINSSATVRLQDVILETNVTYPVILTGNRPAIVNAYGVRTAGSPTTNNNSNTDGSSAINIKTLAALT